jgi:hypothetical protein
MPPGRNEHMSAGSPDAELIYGSLYRGASILRTIDRLKCGKRSLNAVREQIECVRPH